MEAPPEKLSQTGCVKAGDPKQFADIVLPYEVNSPLWSDASDKSRGLVIPAGKQIHVVDCSKDTCAQGVYDDGKWQLPVGSVAIKNFGFDGKLVETRLFVRFDEKNYVGYSYRWDEAQTDATIVPDERVTVMFNTGKRTVEWNYPNRLDCSTCHNNQAFGFIGFETQQMNRVVGGTNQIDALKSKNVFEAPPKSPYAAALVAPYPNQLGSPPATATLDERARSYLHGNCAYCHRPDGDFQNHDLRFGVPMKDMGICNSEPVKGDLGVTGAVNLSPGDPKNSIMYLRMQVRRQAKIGMPQLGTYVVDPDGSELIGQWITSIKSCPQ
ncbi:MAG TPA: hypothetical protein VFQ61_04140 [Polyangiaceae bacterium]|nr:hypothetical protein [Polyangiaceae bacterium]